MASDYLQKHYVMFSWLIASDMLYSVVVAMNKWPAFYHNVVRLLSSRPDRALQGHAPQASQRKMLVSVEIQNIRGSFFLTSSEKIICTTKYFLLRIANAYAKKDAERDRDKAKYKTAYFLVHSYSLLDRLIGWLISSQVSRCQQYSPLSETRRNESITKIIDQSGYRDGSYTEEQTT